MQTCPHDYPQGALRFWIVVTVMLVAIIEVLDVTIVNVALSPMMGALGANSDQITWVLTSYIVSAAIFMVLTGFLVNLLGRRKLLMINIIGFSLSSMFCGFSTSLFQIVLSRTLQGIFGASLIPLSQIILRQTYPPKEHGKAMAIWGVGVMVAPVLGPTLGGYITEYLNWRWIFFINFPVGLVAFMLAMKFIQDYVREKPILDGKGMVLLTLSVACLQLFLDRGNNNDWFQSHSIVLTLFICIMSFGFFIYHAMHHPKPIIDIWLYTNRNFSVGCFLLMNFSIGTMGVISLLPLLLESLFHYSSVTAGLVMAPLGITSAIAMIIIGKLLNQYDGRYFMTLGILLVSLSSYIFSHFNLDTDIYHWIYTSMVLGLGMGFFFVPLSTFVYQTLGQNKIPAAAGLFSFSRNVGSSMGISILTTVITRETQINWNHLAGNIYRGNSSFNIWLQQTHFSLHHPQTLLILQNIIAAQANMIAFANAFYLIAIWMLFLLPFIWSLDSAKVS